MAQKLFEVADRARGIVTVLFTADSVELMPDSIYIIHEEPTLPQHDGHIELHVGEDLREKESGIIIETR